MLQRLVRDIVVVNTDREPRRIYDRQLPTEYIDIPPYDGTPATEVSLSAPMFARNWRRSWLWRADSKQAQAVRDGLAGAVEEGSGFNGMTVKELGEYAASLGIDVPNRIKKDELIALIETAVAAPVGEEDNDETD